MTSRPTRAVLTTAAALGLAAAGAGVGAGLYSSLESGSTTTVVERVDTPSALSEPVEASARLSINEIYQRSHKSVVDLEVTYEDDGGDGFYSNGGVETAEGSGFVRDKQGHIVTNQHVVATRGTITVTLWNGNRYPGRVVGMDRSTDLAVVKVSAPASELEPLEFADSDEVAIGDGVVAIGSPFGLTGSVTSGIISGLHRQIAAPETSAGDKFTISDAIQTDAAINHGNSGGPLLDLSGRVIGINTQIQSEGGGNDGVGFAVPSNTIRKVTEQLVAGETVQHAYLGVSIDVSEAPRGVVLRQIVANGPADRAGLQQGDVITKLDGTEILATNDLSSVIDEKQPGDKMNVTYARGGDTDTATVTLGTRPS